MKHALIIEDRSVIALSIADALQDCGYATADIAISQKDAIRMAEERCPDLITVDELLASGSGNAAVRHICRDNAIPVLWITGVATEVREVVPDAVILEKPFSYQNLCKAVVEAVRSARVYT